MDKSAGESCLSRKKLMKSVTIGSIECVNNESLIPGLPDDLALICLAKISHGFLGVLKCVCKRWRDVIRSEDYAFYKSGMGRCGDWLFVFMQKDRSRYWKAYDPEADRWHPIPPMPRAQELVQFSCVSVCNRLLVIGGYFQGNLNNVKTSCTNQVLSFDPFRQEWTEVASMSTGRAFFACSVICDKVYVGGGYSTAYYFKAPRCAVSNPLSSAEVYDPVKDRWDELPTMPNPPRFLCFGLSYKSKFHILSRVSRDITDIFSLHDRQWCSRRDTRKNPEYQKYRVCVINDHMYTIIEDSVQAVHTVNIGTGDWYHVGSVPPLNLPEHPLLSKIDGALVCSLRNKLYIIGAFAIDPAYRGCDPPPKVYSRTVWSCDPSTTLQWRETTIPGDNCRKLACASLEECLR